MPEIYKALTRKYRPRTFEDIVSQEHVSNTLKNAIEQNRLSHAYMFCGPRGVGKTTMARVLARTVNGIDAGMDGESLNNTLNIIEIDAASNNKVEDVHRIRETVRIPPQSGRYKIYIIDEVHMLSKQAYNAMLKTLEEPPAHVIFIFATTEPQKVLPTIMSRCQRFDFRRITVEEMVGRLKLICEEEKITIDEESLHIIARKADGALRDALGIMDQAIAFCGTDIRQNELLKALNVISTDRLFELMSAVGDNDSNAGLHLINDLLQEGHDIQELLVDLTEHLRNLYVAKNPDNLALIETTDDVRQRFRKVAAGFSEDDLMRMLHISSEAQFRVRDAHQPRIQLEIAILKLINMPRVEGLRELIDELHALKNVQPGHVTTPGEKVSGKNDKKETTGRIENTGTAGNHTNATGSIEEKKTEEPSKITAANRSTRVQRTNIYTGLNIHRGALGESDERNGDEASALGNITGNLALAPHPIDQGDPGEKSSDKTVVNLADLKQAWPVFLTSLEENGEINRMACIGLNKVEPIDWEQNELVLQCYDAFTYNLAEEHKRMLARSLRRYMNTDLGIRCIQQKGTGKEESYDPYSRFKKLQEKDPIIRSIIELFGAELEF